MWFHCIGRPVLGWAFPPKTANGLVGIPLPISRTKGCPVLEATLALIAEYGTLVYLLLFAYCALKSGSLPLFGGYAAQAGALDVGLVATAVFAGGYLGDEVRFAVARRYGAGFLASKPRLSALMDKATAMLNAYGPAYMFLYRYPKGMRTIGALPVGLTTMKWHVFSALNAASALLWTGLLVGAGYYFGALIETAVVAGWGAVSLVLLLVFIGVTVVAWNKLARPAR
jgi:membrane protein DedA with SNARE-associated domain